MFTSISQSHQKIFSSASNFNTRITAVKNQKSQPWSDTPCDSYTLSKPSFGMAPKKRTDGADGKEEKKHRPGSPFKKNGRDGFTQQNGRFIYTKVSVAPEAPGTDIAKQQEKSNAYNRRENMTDDALRKALARKRVATMTGEEINKRDQSAQKYSVKYTNSGRAAWAFIKNTPELLTLIQSASISKSTNDIVKDLQRVFKTDKYKKRYSDAQVLKAVTQIRENSQTSSYQTSTASEASDATGQFEIFNFSTPPPYYTNRVSYCPTSDTKAEQSR